MAFFPRGTPIDRPGVYCRISTFGKEDAFPAPSTIRWRIYISPDGTMHAEGPAYSLGPTGDTLVFAKMVNAVVDGETLVIRNPS